MNTVSILIPAFNAANTLRTTLRSCVEQGASVVEEIIVVDDHSTDSTQGVFEAFSKEHPDFQWIWAVNPKKGACSARNYALELSRGEWIQWLDADDTLGKHKLNAQLELLRHKPITVVTCAFRPFSGDPITGQIEDSRDWNMKTEWEPGEWIAHDQMCIPACWLGSREVMVKAGVWNEQLLVNQDGEYFCRVVAQCEKVLFAPKVEVHYRREGGGVSQFSPGKAESLFNSIESMAKVALRIEDSERMRQMISNRYQSFIYTAYPYRKDLISRAKASLTNLPPPTIFNPLTVSMISKFVAAILGWKTLTRARMLRNRLQW